MNNTQKSQILAFIQGQPYGVISTVKPSGQPEAAVVAVTAMPDLSIIFATSNKTHKHKNLEANPKIAVTIGFDFPFTVQIEGTATLLKGEERREAHEMHLAKHPETLYYDSADDPYYRIKPTWIRYTHFVQGEDAEIIESKL